MFRVSRRLTGPDEASRILAPQHSAGWDFFCPTPVRPWDSEVVMGEIFDIAQWRARKAARSDIPIGGPPFVLAEPCGGCGTRRVSTMVWRMNSTGRRVPFPRIEPHFRCRDGRVLWQDITDAPIPVSAWSGILGHFEQAENS